MYVIAPVSYTSTPWWQTLAEGFGFDPVGPAGYLQAAYKEAAMTKSKEDIAVAAEIQIAVARDELVREIIDALKAKGWVIPDEEDSYADADSYEDGFYLFDVVNRDGQWFMIQVTPLGPSDVAESPED